MNVVVAMAGVQSGELGVPDTGMQKKDYERPDWKLTESGATYRKGKFRSLNGDVYNGEWLNGKRHGKGQVKYANGDRYLGTWDAWSGLCGHVRKRCVLPRQVNSRRTGTAASVC